MHTTIRKWLEMSREELDTIYSAATPGRLPSGDTRGTAIVTGTSFSRALARGARMLAWQGKVFDLMSPESGLLINKVTPFSLTFIVAKVYRDASWLDGNPTIVIDYSKTSTVARAIRDEIREIEPDVYLGKVWWGKKRVLDFALEPTVAHQESPIERSA